MEKSSNKKYLQLDDIEAYRISFDLSNYVWKIILSWDVFSKQTVGSQIVRSIDSISANIAEGFGRYWKKDKIRFYRISSGSLSESLDWNQKALIRNLISKEQYYYISSELSKLPRAINSLILYTNNKLKY